MQTEYLRTRVPLALLPAHCVPSLASTLRTCGRAARSPASALEYLPGLTRLSLSSLALFSRSLLSLSSLQASHALAVEAGEVRSAWLSADGATLAYGDASVCRVQVLTLLALLVQKHKY
jgi:hypothetical protein